MILRNSENLDCNSEISRNCVINLCRDCNLSTVSCKSIALVSIRLNAVNLVAASDRIILFVSCLKGLNILCIASVKSIVSVT